jgi:NADH dehydrogenase FAD-containing subunit
MEANVKSAASAVLNGIIGESEDDFQVANRGRPQRGRTPLARLLDPIGVQHRVAEITAIDPISQEATVETEHGRERPSCDRLVLTLGSELVRPAIPGLPSLTQGIN